MRASVENPSLARVLGIDVERAYVFAWFLAGGFAATAGSFSALWLQGGTTLGSELIVEIGGLIIGATEILLTQAGIALFGSWISIYQKGFPLLIMVITLLLFPRGLVSIQWGRIVRPIIALARSLEVRLGQVIRFARGN
jgi:branched-chain amino acid transport system permease protein